MTNKLGHIVPGDGGTKAISLYPTISGKIQLPECMNNVPIGVIAYVDHEGKIAFMDGDPNDR